MGLNEFILAINTAGTLAIGSITFFIVYTTFKGIEDEKIQDFSKKFMTAIAVLILYVSYLMMYNSFFAPSVSLKLPLYLILALVFIYLIRTAISFEQIAEAYGVSEDSKLEKMKREEMG